jgi:hypothetical protein
MKKTNKMEAEPVLPDRVPSETEPLPDMDRRTKPRKGLGEELIEIYETSGDDLDSLTVFEHGRKRWQKMLVWILLFLVAVFIGTAAFSWFIWGRQPIFKGEQVVFEIQAPEESTSGQTITYVLKYGNDEAISFRKSEIELRYPSGFQFIKSNPEPLSNTNLWDLGSLSPGQQGTIEVEGVLVGTPDVPTTLSGMFRYWPANFSSEFNEVASAQTTLKPVEIDVRLEGPEQVLVGQKSTYTVIYNNPTETIYKDLRVEFFYPSDFVVETTKPEAPDEKNLFLIPELAPNQEKEIQISGFFAAAGEESATMIAEVGIKGGTDEYFVQRKLTRETKIIRGDLVVNVVANGSNKDTSVQWDDSIHASISFANNSETTLSDLRVVATLESRYRTQTSGKGNEGALDWAALVDSSRGSLKELPATDNKTLRKRSITWTSEDLDALEKLDQKQEGSIDFQVPLYDLTRARAKMQHPEDVEILLTVEVSVGKTGGVAEQTKVIGNPIRFLVDSDLLLDAHVRYYDKDGNQIGSGELPPKAGQKSEYRVFWKLTNTLHEVEEVVVTADLPDNVAWLNKFEVSAGEVIYTASSHSLAWKLNRIPLDVKEINLSFAVELTPTASQIGTVAPLTKKMTLTALDSNTGGKIIQTVNPVTTAADRDSLASDKGVVVN